MTKFNTKFNKGFTLIELLVVISIIGLLSTLTVTSLSSSRKRARDTQRLNDLYQIAKAQELYYGANNNVYASAIIDLKPTYLPTEPKDPSTASSYTLYPKVAGDWSGYCVWAASETDTTKWYSFSDKGPGTKGAAPTTYVNCAP